MSLRLKGQIKVKLVGRAVDALALGAEEGRDKRRKCLEGALSKLRSGDGGTQQVDACYPFIKKLRRKTQ